SDKTDEDLKGKTRIDSDGREVILKVDVTKKQDADSVRVDAQHEDSSEPVVSGVGAFGKDATTTVVTLQSLRRPGLYTLKPVFIKEGKSLGQGTPLMLTISPKSDSLLTTPVFTSITETWNVPPAATYDFGDLNQTIKLRSNKIQVKL